MNDPIGLAPDRFDGRQAMGVTGRLGAFNRALVLSTADVHVAARLGAITGDSDDVVLLAAALAVRAARIGHVCVDLAKVALTTIGDAEDDVDIGSLPWPSVDEWITRLASSPLVGLGENPETGRPLHLIGTLLYLDRYLRQERSVADDLEARAAAGGPVDIGVLSSGLDRMFPGDQSELQRLGAAVAVLRRFAVIAGGPGTGKTTTVARLVALLDEQATTAGGPPPKIALAAPTGKAAARLEEGVHGAAATLDVPAAVSSRLLGLRASTLHRLLGTRPDSRSRFRHDDRNRLPYDTVIVDETSMVALSMMARLVEALRPDTRLVLLGDPDQLSSVEAGAVLGDIVGPAADGLRMSTAARTAASEATRLAVPDEDRAGARSPGPAGIGDGVVVLRHVHRFGSGIAALAEAIRSGDSDASVRALTEHPGSVTWHRAEADLDAVRTAVVATGRAAVDAAACGDGRSALRALATTRLLCAHRSGPSGAATWMATAEGWLAAAIPGYGTGGRWYVGRPLLVTRNDYGLNLSNGDVGVIVATGPGRTAAAFERGGAVALVAPSRLEAVETVHAMTIHKSQGSQFDTVGVVLPDADSRILTRELLYTAVTRARRHVHLIGDEASVRAGVAREVARASGLRPRLWGDETGG